VPQSRVIASYLAALLARLPADIVDELADGLAEAHESYLRQGLASDKAAEAAVAEFGEPDVIASAFTRASAARVISRRLLVIGPVVGTCWAAALVAGHAWDWPVPDFARVLLGLALMATIALLAVAARSSGYQVCARTGRAACASTTALDTAMIVGVILSAPTISWFITAALVASTCRIALAVPALLPTRR
jgi:hypothetical protein